ncbi:nucleoside hydrolase [Paenarthrobacter sp. PH39-S1]|nr:nucleoside hydrolase [Paenarthrobacter sp. PH39-S1]MDJ0357526.1 nucleoside hydrolase [Paenarthrobacter sp. PH39-S1]
MKRCLSISALALAAAITLAGCGSPHRHQYCRARRRQQLEQHAGPRPRLATADVVARIEAVGTKPARFVMELMEFFAKTYKDAQGFDYPRVHDPCAVAYVIDPSVMTTQKVPVDIELNGTLTLGMTVADFRAPAPADCNTSVAVKLDHQKFWDLVTDALVRIGDVEA